MKACPTWNARRQKCDRSDAGGRTLTMYGLPTGEPYRPGGVLAVDQEVWVTNVALHRIEIFDADSAAHLRSIGGLGVERLEGVEDLSVRALLDRPAPAGEKGASLSVRGHRVQPPGKGLRCGRVPGGQLVQGPEELREVLDRVADKWTALVLKALA